MCHYDTIYREHPIVGYLQINGYHHYHRGHLQELSGWFTDFYTFIRNRYRYMIIGPPFAQIKGSAVPSWYHSVTTNTQQRWKGKGWIGITYISDAAYQPQPFTSLAGNDQLFSEEMYHFIKTTIKDSWMTLPGWYCTTDQVPHSTRNSWMIWRKDRYKAIGEMVHGAERLGRFQRFRWEGGITESDDLKLVRLLFWIPLMS